MSGVEPNKALSSGKVRYPNQFFDLSQQYMPPTIKELFKWCTFYYYNSPLIGSAIKKVSRYPITDIIYEDSHDSIRGIWKKILTEELKMKDRLMEVNLDFHGYGNAFVSLHFPTTRFLVCKSCGVSKPIKQMKWRFNGRAYSFSASCTCGYNGEMRVKDVPYKNRKDIRLIRWNPENITVKYNEYTGKTTYLYTVPRRLRGAIERGDKDIIEDTPMIVIEAVQKNKRIKLHPDAIRHLKNPSLAEQDQGWGKPNIIHVLKDMFYFYTLRRAQEAIAMEHILPMDILFPSANASFDPYVHTDLGSWRTKIEEAVQKHRQDPNYKAVMPVPVGHQRVGGDGRALMLSPEMNYLTQTIIGGLGFPSEFVMGGLNFTGSSISLRMLENDFIQNRSQLLDLLIWVKDKIRIWLSLPDIKGMRFADFRMADDIQRNQQIVGLNAQNKLSDETMLTELGFNYEDETRKIIQEAYLKNFISDLQFKGQAKSQGEANIINYNYQQKVQEMAEKAQEQAMHRAQEATKPKVLSNVGETSPYPKPKPQMMDPYGNVMGLAEGTQFEAADPAAAQQVPQQADNPAAQGQQAADQSASKAQEMNGANMDPLPTQKASTRRGMV